MDKNEKFKDILKHRGTELVKAGIKYHTVYAWQNGLRLPSEKNAKKIATILDIPIYDIPYWGWY